MQGRPHCYEHPDLRPEVDMQLHGELFRLGSVDQDRRRQIAERYRSKGGIAATESARILVEKLGLDIAEIKGTGDSGRLTEGDVRMHQATPHARRLIRSLGLEIADIEGDREGRHDH